MVTWKGAWYYRKRSNNWRNANTGHVGVAPKKIIGIERKGKHFFGNDPRKVTIKKKPKTPVLRVRR